MRLRLATLALFVTLGIAWAEDGSLPNEVLTMDATRSANLKLGANVSVDNGRALVLPGKPCVKGTRKTETNHRSELIATAEGDPSHLSLDLTVDKVLASLGGSSRRVSFRASHDTATEWLDEPLAVAKGNVLDESCFCNSGATFGTYFVYSKITGGALVSATELDSVGGSLNLLGVAKLVFGKGRAAVRYSNLGDVEVTFPTDQSKIVARSPRLYLATLVPYDQLCRSTLEGKGPSPNRVVLIPEKKSSVAAWLKAVLGFGASRVMVKLPDNKFTPAKKR